MLPKRNISGLVRGREATNPAHSPSAGKRGSNLELGKGHPARSDRGGGSVPVPAATTRGHPSPRGAAGRYLATACSPTLDLPTSVCRSQESRKEDEGDVPAVGTGSQRGEGKDSAEEPRRLRPLQPLRQPVPRGWMCRRGRVLGILAAERSTRHWRGDGAPGRSGLGRRSGAGHPPLGAC